MKSETSPTGIDRYIGLAYDAVHYNCWHFFRQFQQEYFGVTLPDYALDARDIRTVTTHVLQTRCSGNWQPINTPKHGCTVLMRRSRHPIHLGCWLDDDAGGVLHNAEGMGVVFQSPIALMNHGWHIDGYFLYRPQQTQ